MSVGGAFFGATPRIVSVNSRPVEARPHGVILVLENTDRPGIVGRIGTLLGEHNVNIATMSLSRNQAGGTALTVLNLDNAPDEELLQEIRASGLNQLKGPGAWETFDTPTASSTAALSQTPSTPVDVKSTK